MMKATKQVPPKTILVLDGCADSGGFCSVKPVRITPRGVLHGAGERQCKAWIAQLAGPTQVASDNHF